ncbi:MAG: cobalamin-dependent protein [Elusimicrobiota bacterium]|jgi:putative methyltransferase
MSPKEIYLHEFNVAMEKSIYLPLASGLLQAYAQTIPVLRENYRFMPLRFVRGDLAGMMEGYGNPDVAGFSVSMWNMNLSLAIAERLKSRFPGCLVVFGGPQVPFEAADFFREHPFIDAVVRGEGEKSFAEILERALSSRDFSGIDGISYRDPKDGSCVKNPGERQVLKDLDVYPSPYLAGVYDSLFSQGLDFQVIIETNRGCPYNCSYCFWGKGGLSKKYGFFSLERVKAEAQWCGARGIKYVFCADSNFGAFKRDLEIARYFVEAKLAGGFPEKFRVCYAKNTEDTVFEIGKLLHSHQMEKSITMARQTNNEEAALNVNRKNIKMEVFNKLQRKYNQEKIPVYTEIILGFPGESYLSFKEGLEQILRSGLKNQIFVYLCQVYPNTELNDPAYREKHLMSTVRIPLHETHAAVRAKGLIEEHEEIITGTRSMSAQDWKRMFMLAWTTQLFHSLKLGFFIMLYLNDRYKIGYTGLLERIISLEAGPGGGGPLRRAVERCREFADSILKGGPRTVEMPEFGSIYWDAEEAGYLGIIPDKEDFYRELLELVAGYLDEQGIAYDRAELGEAMRYQEAMIPGLAPEDREHSFEYNMPEYFEAYFSESRAEPAKRPQVLTVTALKDCGGDKKMFAREVVLFGRKSDRMLKIAKWRGR